MTRNGIEYNLKISPYIQHAGEFCFFFSSQFYLDKYNKEVLKTRQCFKDLAEKRHGVVLNPPVGYCELSLYLKIEKRGARVTYKGDEIECPENITFDGGKPIMPPCQEL